jgi:indole-3-glycerol phosphate synthase
MTEQTPDILQRILAETRRTVARREAQLPLDEVRAHAVDTPERHDFRGALTAEGLSLIAEFKRASPSKGTIREGAEPAEIAQTYEVSGARSMSVLTDEPFFRGSCDDLRHVREAVDLPILRKDFIVSPWQIWEARLIGADAVLLIVAALNDDELRFLLDEAVTAGLAVLVETHTEREVSRALTVDAEIIGINNRDLNTFKTDLETTERLRATIPRGKIIVSESGIHTGEDVHRLRRADVDAVLVGESLMASDDISGQIAALLDT